MYAIRSYYVENDSDVDSGDSLVVATYNVTSALGAPVLVNSDGTFTLTLTGRGGHASQPELCRITSYNVCYTKLLRGKRFILPPIAKTLPLNKL